jgi:DNA-binding response OmpR family regulator
MKTRLSYAETQIMECLRLHPTRHLSYDDLTAQIGTLDRRTVITAMRRLETRRLIVTVRGQGCCPNRYLLTDVLFVVAQQSRGGGERENCRGS